MTDNSRNNRVIAVNTIMLYMRMILVMLVSLYTSRIVLATLGVDDFGIYNVVGGIVAMMSFLSSALTAASQRFISYELGHGDKDNLKKVFSTSITVHTLLALICVLVFESIGIWFLNTHMNIASDRMTAANWVFQCSIAAFVVNVANVPYNALIIAHEKMGVFAYISILEATLKLFIAILLTIIDIDKLIVYGILQLCTSFLIRICYKTYCKHNFEESRCWKFNLEPALFKKLFSFTGWSVVGNVGFTLKEPLLNILLNMFCGTAVNAAKGISTQVNSLVNSFATNFSMAMNPQIVKRYASGDIQYSMELVYTGARLSFLMLTLISVPIIINIDYILQLWLKEVPNYTATFSIITIVSSLIFSLSSTSSTAIQATGNIKWFSIGVCVIPLIDLPIAYILLFMKFPPYIALIPSVITNLFALLFRFGILKSIVIQYSWKHFILNVVFRSFLTFSLAICISYYTDVYIDSLKLNELISTIISFSFSLFAAALSIYYVGLEKKERKKILNVIIVKIKKK